MSFAFLPFYTGDYLRDTRHLSTSKHGIYLLLLMHCWDQKGPIPLDEQEAAGIANCRSTDEIEALRYILGKYFVRCEDGWYNDRMQREVDRADAISGARQSAGRAGANARMAKLRERQANAQQLPSKSSASVQQVTLPPPPPLPLQPEIPPHEREAPRSIVYPPGFSEFWKAYPRKQGKDKAFTQWKRLRPDRAMLDAMLAALVVQKASVDWRKDNGAFIPHPSTWLSGGRWKDEPTTGDGLSVTERVMAQLEKEGFK
jgi:uncharacterized protein YdaU (DUF1376 family)